MQLPIWLALLLVVIALAAGIFAGYLYRKKVAEKEIGTAEDEAKRIINEAIKSAEAKKRESVVEAREEIFRARTENERECKERRAEVQKQERRLQQKEENLDHKTEVLEKKEEALAAKHTALDKEFTFYVVYGSCVHTVNYEDIHVITVESDVMSMEETNDYIRENIGRKVVMVGASTGTDAHTVGIDAIMNRKGFAGHYGVERYEMVELSLIHISEPTRP